MTTFTEFTYSGLKAFVEEGLTPAPDSNDPPLPELNPGPPSYEGTADTVGPAVVLTIGGGPGLFLEDTYDQVMVSVDVAGEQMDYDSAEYWALRLDRLLLSVASPRVVQGVRWLAVRRAGGRPTPVGVDDGDRWHLACSYVIRVRSGY